MLVKYINENSVERANNKQILKYKDKQIINPKDENFIEAGYKPLEIEEEPTYNIETEYLQPYYVEQENKIIQNWELKEIKEEEYDEIS